MAKFTVRVELHNAYGPDYEVLHKAMMAVGFGNWIQADDGKMYVLPPAEYDFIGDFAGEDVRQLATNAASKTGKTYAVLVTVATARYWQGLPFANQ